MNFMALDAGLQIYNLTSKTFNVLEEDRFTAARYIDSIFVNIHMRYFY